MGARNRVGIGLSCRPARLYRLAVIIPWNRFLGSINVPKYGLRQTEGKNLVWFGEIERKLAKLFMTIPILTILPLIYFMSGTKRNKSLSTNYQYQCFIIRLKFSEMLKELSRNLAVPNFRPILLQ
jgi:hypothetical protein